jgi:peptide deformylase
MQDGVLRIDTGSGIIKDFQIYKVLGDGDPALKTKLTEPVDFTSQNLQWLVKSMFQTMHKYGGIGLAANQVGLPYRMFVIGDGGQGGVAFLNPEIISTSDEDVVENEGCLSFPALILKVKRPRWVWIRYQDVTGAPHEQTFTGLTARVIMHEFDHIEGKTFTDHCGKLSLSMAREKQRKLLKKVARRG